jgi:hypothetical protein
MLYEAYRDSSTQDVDVTVMSPSVQSSVRCFTYSTDYCPPVPCDSTRPDPTRPDPTRRSDLCSRALGFSPTPHLDDCLIYNGPQHPSNFHGNRPGGLITKEDVRLRTQDLETVIITTVFCRKDLTDRILWERFQVQ